jgi:hypothetical protein
MIESFLLDEASNVHAKLKGKKNKESFYFYQSYS